MRNTATLPSKEWPLDTDSRLATRLVLKLSVMSNIFTLLDFTHMCIYSSRIENCEPPIVSE